MTYNTTVAGSVKRKVISHYMTDGQQPDYDRRPYHHGDLRRDLLRVARAEIARHGADGVSLAALARLAGVSQPAPYRHFADRHALLEAVAAQGFVEFAATLAAVLENDGAAGALTATALAYVSFGEANIELYRLMFASRLTPKAEAGSDLDEAAGRAFALLHTAIATAPPDSTGAHDVYLYWARLHGLVMLKADGFIEQPLASYVDALP